MFELEDGTRVSGQFFGQSGFAEVSIVKRNSLIVVNAFTTHEDLKLLVPLTCDLTTGAGCVTNETFLRSEDVVLVTGLGAVGLGAVMAAKALGRSTIVGVDQVSSRLDLAKSVGADYVVNTKELGDWVDTVERLTNGGVSLAVETTAAVPIIHKAVAALSRWGTIILVGMPPMNAGLDLPVTDLFYHHKSITSTVMGGGNKQESIGRMLRWWKDGNFLSRD